MDVNRDEEECHTFEHEDGQVDVQVLGWLHFLTKTKTPRFDDPNAAEAYDITPLSLLFEL